MNLPFFIARKYYFSRKLPNVIHLISGVSVAGITVGAFALITVLSVFNGLEGLVLSLYSRFDSDIRIEPLRGKYFDAREAGIDSIERMDGVLDLTGVIEENIMLRYDEQQTVGTFKAIEPNYLSSLGMDTMVYRGYARLEYDDIPYALIGAGLSNQLNINVYDEFSRVQLFLPRPGQEAMLRPERSFNRKRIAAGGVFAIQQEFDNEYIIIPLSFARELTDREPYEVTAIEINLRSSVSQSQMRKQIAEIAGADFEVKDRFQQHEFLHRVMQGERVAVYAILTFILLISSFNMVGALLMLAIEKKKDMSILSTMGLRKKSIQQIFIFEGMLLSFTGAAAGLILGALVSWLQMEFGLVSLGGSGTFVVESYPVEMRVWDFLMVFLTVTVIGFAASIFPAWTAGRNLESSDPEED